MGGDMVAVEVVDLEAEEVAGVRNLEEGGEEGLIEVEGDMEEEAAEEEKEASRGSNQDKASDPWIGIDTETLFHSRRTSIIQQKTTKIWTLEL